MSLMKAAKYPPASMGCFMVVVVAILFSSTCEGQEDTQSSVVPLLIDAEPVVEPRFPYMCSVRKRGSGRHVCGGVLIDKQWVMTAAHCLDPDNQGTAGMSPFLYCDILKREDDDSSKRFSARRCHLHHLWDGHVRNGNDIALCQLENSVDVDVPDLSNVGDAFTKNEIFSVLGWGRTSSRGDLADNLRIGEGLRYIPPEDCNETEEWTGRIKNSMICAGLSLSNTCKGDSGGPLFIRHDPVSATKSEDPLLDLIIGITSFGFRDCEVDVPGVYTRVSCYRPWIDCIMQGTGQDCSVHSPCDEDLPPPSGGDSPPSSGGDSPPSSGGDYPPSSGVDYSLCSGVQKSATFDESDALQRVKSAISSDDSATVKQLLCDGLSPNAVYVSANSSLLQRASQYNAIETAKVLLEHGAEIEYKNSFGQAALSLASGYGSAAVAELLIEDGANIETRDAGGWTPLIYTAEYNHVEVARMLIDNGANLESIDNRRRSSLHFSAEKNSIDVAKILIANGASISASDQFGWTALHLASSRGHVSVVRTLLSNGASKTRSNDAGETPFDVICTDGDLEEPCKNDDITTLRELLEV